MESYFEDPFKLGITGGIGSGKTSVCRVFSILGIPVFSADAVAKDIMDSDSTIKDSINSFTGRDLYAGGSLNRQELAGLIFSDESLLGKVNSIVHPVVFNNFSHWCRKQDSPYVIMEAAILFESGAWQLVDRIATVVAPEEERIQRVVKRNNLSREQVLERMKNQINDEERVRRSDYVIANSEMEMIIPAVLKIHEEILNQIKWQA